MNAPTLIIGSLALAASFLLSSCTTTGSPSRNRYETAASLVQKGQSKAQIKNYLGDPKRRELSPKGETWIYGGSQRTAADELVNVGMGMIPYGGGSVIRSIGNSKKSKAPGARITFDQTGRVTNYVFDLP